MIIIEDLVEEAKKGNKDAYSKLIVSIQNDLYKIARSRLSNADDAQDAVQETIINAYLGINKLKDNKSFKSWITKILINECNSIYNKHKRKSEVDEKYVSSNDTSHHDMDNSINFEDMIESLNEKEKKIFSLYYEDCLNIKQIAKLLNMNENTVKTILHRGKVKIKKSYKPATMFILILCVLVATSVIAISIISYIKSLFEVNSVGIENDGILAAIEHLEWFQEIDMAYQDLNNGYKIKTDYLLMDEMNLYIVFDITSEEDISKFTDIAFPDLKIVDENGEVICDESDIFAEHYSKKTSAKVVENNKHNMKVLIYMYTDSFPESKTLNISFTKLMFLSQSLFGGEQFSDITANASFKIDLEEKFINRNYISYSSENNKIEKAIITETGFYALVNKGTLDNITDSKLIDEDGNSYDCYYNILSTANTLSDVKYIVMANFINKESSNLKLIINGDEYLLTKYNK